MSWKSFWNKILGSKTFEKYAFKVAMVIIVLALVLIPFFYAVWPNREEWYTWVIFAFALFVGWFIFLGGWRKLFPKSKK